MFSAFIVVQNVFIHTWSLEARESGGFIVHAFFTEYLSFAQKQVNAEEGLRAAIRHQDLGVHKIAVLPLKKNNAGFCGG